MYGVLQYKGKLGVYSDAVYSVGGVNGISSWCPLPRMTKHVTVSTIAMPMATPNAVILASAMFIGHYMKHLDFLCFLLAGLERSRIGGTTTGPTWTDKKWKKRVMNKNLFSGYDENFVFKPFYQALVQFCEL